MTGLSPAILRFLRRVVDQAKAANVPVGVCGEMGGRTLEAMALIGIGLERFSITPVAVGAIKAMIRSLDREKLMPVMDRLLANPREPFRPVLTRWAEENGVEI